MPRVLFSLKATTTSPCIWARRGPYPAGCSTLARTKRTAQEPGRPSPFLDTCRLGGEPVTRLRRTTGRRAHVSSATVAQNKRPHRGRSRTRGTGVTTEGGGGVGGSTLEDMSTGLVKVVERAQREPEGRFHALAHLIDVPALERAYRRQRADAAVGVDGVTKEQYGQELEAHLQGLHARLKAQRYRHQPLRRVHIPKGQGKTRPIGIAAFEDKLVQDAVREVLEVIYEQDFLDCSYGFRPGRSAHDAVRILDQIVHRGEAEWILEADIVSFFDSLDRTELKRMLELRVVDGSLLRLIGKCLHVGVLDGEALLEPELGTAQGSVLS